MTIVISFELVQTVDEETKVDLVVYAILCDFSQSLIEAM